MRELEFKANISNIARFERETGKPLTSVFDSFDIDEQGVARGFSADVILQLAIAMTKTDEDTIDAFTEEFGPTKLIEKVFSALETNGFLAGMAKETEVQPDSQPKATAPSQSTGKASK